MSAYNTAGNLTFKQMVLNITNAFRTQHKVATDTASNVGEDTLRLAELRADQRKVDNLVFRGERERTSDFFGHTNL